MATQITVTNNYYYAGYKQLPVGARPPQMGEGSSNLKNWHVSNATDAANKAAADIVKAEPVKPKSNLKKYLLIAAWVIGMIAGLTLGILGIVHNPMLTEVGALMLTAFSGMGAKVIECILSHKDYRD